MLKYDAKVKMIQILRTRALAMLSAKVLDETDANFAVSHIIKH